MKTIFLLCIVLCGYSTVYAQDSLKAYQGKFTTELNVNPFQGELSLNNSINQLKFRYFVAENMALRLGLNADVINKKSDAENVYGTNPYSIEASQKSTTLGINLGIEKHFSGTRRLSPYAGAEFLFVSKSSSQNNENRNSSGEIQETTIEGAWQEWEIIRNQYGDLISSMTFTERGYNQYSLNLVAGFDFYFAENFFFGYEFTFGFSQLRYKDIDITSSPESDNLDTSDVKETEFSLGANLLNGIRLGFVF